MRPIRIALTEGRLEKKAVGLFEQMGLDCTQLIDKGRRLILPVGPYEAVLAKAADVITYVEHGVCDLGIVGKDAVAEHLTRANSTRSWIWASAGAGSRWLAARGRTSTAATP